LLFAISAVCVTFHDILSKGAFSMATTTAWIFVKQKLELMFKHDPEFQAQKPFVLRETNQSI
jgi:hypothetical protein